MKKYKFRFVVGACLIAALLAISLAVHVKPTHADVPNGMTGSGLATDPYQIATCGNLENVDLNSAAYYELTQNIDCSSLSSGLGFIPIGLNSDGSIANTFSGHFDGQGFTISNLHINQALATNSDGEVGLFADTDHSFMHDFTVSAATVTAPAVPNATGGIIGEANGDTIERVHFNGSITATCDFKQEVGGVTGQNSGVVILDRSSSSGAITRSGTDCGGHEIMAGGMVGESANTAITNDYSTTSITLAGSATDPCTGTDCYQVIGGLLGFGDALPDEIDSSYMSGNLSVSVSNNTFYVGVGGVVGLFAGTITNSFSQAVITHLCAAALKCSHGALLGLNYAALDTFSTDYYDQTVTGESACADAWDTTCNAVNTSGSPDSTYFDNNSTNHPYNQWDFANAWTTTAGLPTNQGVGAHPGAPQNVTAVANSNSDIQLSWDAPASLNGTVSGYEYSYRKAGDTKWTLGGVTDNNSSQSVHVGNLDTQTSYSFRVSTLNTNGYWSSPGTDQSFTLGNIYPDAPINLAATTVNRNRIDLSWDAPAYTGDSAIQKYEVDYQKVGDSGWTFFANTNSDPSQTLQVTDLTPGTTYNLRVIAINTNNNGSGPATVQAATATDGFTVINSCQDLQNINNNTDANYELGQDINCASLASQNGGAGFTPIGGCDVSSPTPFVGIFEGNNHTISNLVINQSSAGCYAGLFSITYGALIQDLKLASPIITSATGVGQVGIASISAVDTDSSFKNIQVTNGTITAAAASGDVDFVGGLVGTQAEDTSVTSVDISQNSFSGSITTSGHALELFTGGLIAQVVDPQVPTTISNDFTNAVTSFTAQVDAYEVYGGLVGGMQGDAPTTVTNNYSGGSFNESGAAASGGRTAGGGGLFGFVLSSTSGQISLNNSFSHLSVIHMPAASANNIFGGIYGIDALGSGSVPSLSTDYFDADLMGLSACTGDHSLTNCHVISSQPNYFFNNSTNPPLDQWDFSNTWETTSNLPILGKLVTETLTPIAPERLLANPLPKVAKTPATPTLPTIVPSTKKSSAVVGIATKSPPSPTAPQQPASGLIGQIKKLLGHVPTKILVSFPYVLFALLLAGALAMLVEVWRQSRRLKNINFLLAEQRRIAEERDTFWHLAANYLRAPITLLMGVSDLIDTKSAAGAKLVGITDDLKTKVSGIMQAIEKSTSLRGITWPDLQPGRRIIRSLRFWIPLACVAVLGVLADYLAHDFKHIRVSSITYGVQLMIFILVSLLLFWVLNALGVISSKRKRAEAILAQQSAALDSARRTLITKTAEDLDGDVTRLEDALKAVPPTEKALPILAEGASRLRHIIDSFQLLINAQDHTLSGLSPDNATTGLARALKSSLNELQPEIDSKHLTVKLPSNLTAVIAGSTKLNDQLLSSVMANAVAFSPTNGTITVTSRKTAVATIVSVADKGPGITKEQLNHVFQPFVKADGSDALQLDHGGLGINLYLDKLLLEYLGGSLHIDSTPGSGTTITLEWPATNETQAGSLIVPSRATS